MQDWVVELGAHCIVGKSVGKPQGIVQGVFDGRDGDRR